MNIKYVHYLKYCEINNINRETYPFIVFINKFLDRLKKKYFGKTNPYFFLGYLTDLGHTLFNRYLIKIIK